MTPASACPPPPAHSRGDWLLPCLVPLLALLLVCGSPAARAGDPAGVNQSLGGLRSNWPGARFSVDVLGLVGNAAVTGQAVQVQYEAASPGYLAYLRVSSHGDIAGYTVPAQASRASGELTLPIRAPLGDEAAVFLYSQQPLKGLFDGAASGLVLGADKPHADAFVRRMEKLQSHGAMLMVRRIHYLVEAPEGQTQYTTRSIMRRMAAASQGGAPRPIPTRIEFEFDSDRLTLASRRDLDVFGAAMLARLRDGRVTLEGHTDRIGTPLYNMGLSVRRATAARRYLLESFGLPSSQLRTTGKGASDPIATNETEEGRSQNRRVDFLFEGTGP